MTFAYPGNAQLTKVPLSKTFQKIFIFSLHVEFGRQLPEKISGTKRALDQTALASSLFEEPNYTIFELFETKKWPVSDFKRLAEDGHLFQQHQCIINQGVLSDEKR